TALRAGGVIVSSLRSSGFLRGWIHPGRPPLFGVSLSTRVGQVVAGAVRLRGVALKTLAAGSPSLEGLTASFSARAAGYRLGDEIGSNLVARGQWQSGEGQIRLSARARRWGRLAAAARFRLIGGGRVALRLVRLAGLGLRTVGRSRLVIGPGRVDLDRLRLVGRGGHVTLRRVRWSPDGLSGDLSAVVSLGRWTSLLGLRAGLRGRLTLRAGWRGSAANPVVRVTAALRSFGWKRLVIRAADMKLDYAGRRARLKLLVRSAGARFEMAGHLPLNLALTGSGRPGLVNGPVRLRAAGSLPDLGRLGLKYAGLRRLSGRGRLSLVVSGTMNRPLISGRLQLSRMAFRYQSSQGGFRGLNRFQVKASADLRLSYRAGRLALQGRLTSGPAAWAEGHFQQAGRLSLAAFQWRPQGRPEWRVTAAVPRLAKLDLHLPGIIGLKGGLRATLAAGRAAGRRHLIGQIDLKNVSFRSIPQGMDIQRLSGRVRFTGERIVIDRLAGRSGRGRIALSGEVAMAGLVPRAFRLKFAAQRALVRSTNVRVEMDADMKLGGTWAKPRVDGRVVIKGARLGAGPEFEAGGGDVIVVEDVASPRDLNRSLAVGPGGELAKRLAINVRVDIPNQTPVTGLGLNVEMNGRIGVHKAAGEDLRIRGMVRIQQGFFILQGNRFYINRGRVVFAGLKKPNPSLDLTFEQRGRGFSYILHVRGTAESPRFELRREPPLPSGQLARFLSTSKTSGGRDGITDVGGMAGAMIGNVVLQDFTRLVKLPLAPDQVRVVTDEFSGAPGVEVGKYFGQSPSPFLLRDGELAERGGILASQLPSLAEVLRQRLEIAIDETISYDSVHPRDPGVDLPDLRQKVGPSS
ncbi:MAG: translocation/assembly module TamB domain-containing protein, partial [Proteobacteria bacterium]|nr:translocation/assembly module TamB domain-containing protein [Pseudomonadota bacterium]